MSFKSLTDQEYLDLIQKLVDHQYDDAIEDYDIDKMEWVPAEAEIKAKIPKLNNQGMIDLTHVKASKLKEEILKCGNLRIGSFKVTLTHYHEVPTHSGAQFCVDLTVREEKTKTPNGQECRIDQRADLLKDSRFKGKPWLKYFKDGSYGHNIPIDTVAEIVRWMQAIKKLSAFL